MKKSYDQKRREGNMMYGPTKHERTHKRISECTPAHQEWMKQRVANNLASVSNVGQRRGVR